MQTRFMIFAIGSVLLCLPLRANAEVKFLSHPPLRTLPGASTRKLASGPAFYVDAAKGDDSAEGSKAAPWKTVAHGFASIRAGDSLVLRGGVYYERLYCSLAGTAERPVTVRSHPGELAVIDGSLREFSEAPTDAWEPVTGGSTGEYRSKRTYRNLRNLHGRFGDSMVGLQIYYYIEDLRGERYVGPGVWYDRAAGRIHIRLQHYQKEGVVRGRTDLARKLLPSPLPSEEMPGCRARSTYIGTSSAGPSRSPTTVARPGRECAGITTPYSPHPATCSACVPRRGRRGRY